MKQFLFPLLCIGLIAAQFSCTKDDADTNAQQVTTTSTTTSQTAIPSSDYLVFAMDTIKQFNKSQSVASSHFVLKATHITSDPVVNITLADAAFPIVLPQNYTVTQSALTDGKCGITIMYGGRFYVATAGALKVSLLNGKKGYTLTGILCTSAADPQSRNLSGVLTAD